MELRGRAQIEGYQMASTCLCTHPAVFFHCSRTDTEWPFLLLMHRFPFYGYLVLIYSPSLLPLKELAADLLPLLYSLTHFLLLLSPHTLSLYVLSLSTPLLSYQSFPFSLSLSHFSTCLPPFFLLPHLFYKSDFALLPVHFIFQPTFS